MDRSPARWNQSSTGTHSLLHTMHVFTNVFYATNDDLVKVSVKDFPGRGVNHFVYLGSALAELIENPDHSLHEARLPCWPSGTRYDPVPVAQLGSLAIFRHLFPGNTHYFLPNASVT